MDFGKILEELKDLKDQFDVLSNQQFPTASELSRIVDKDRCKIKKLSNTSILVESPVPSERKSNGQVEALKSRIQMAFICIKYKKEAFSPKLQFKCLEHPITVVKGIANALNLDLNLFSTNKLVEVDPEMLIDFRRQYFKNLEENVNCDGKKLWNCDSIMSQGTLAEYAKYQAENHYTGEENEPESKKGKYLRQKKIGKGVKVIKFGTNIDLLDDVKWKDQLDELKKLPPFARVDSAGNMLSHVGFPILGMNAVQVYLKVEGCRTPGHQENNNFCSVNINIGPGDCEWYAVAFEYWESIKTLCENNEIDYLSGSWWPDLDDCEEFGIPVYRFIQKPGDLVYVNTGCVHWVQAISSCNNIAWNVGPITVDQYEKAISRFEYNRLVGYKSLVPMIHLSWNLARNVRVAEFNLFQLIKGVLQRTLVQCIKTLYYLKSKRVPIKVDGRYKNESAYCAKCQLEVFNILLFKKQPKNQNKFEVFCLDCAHKVALWKLFDCLQPYSLDELYSVYDKFILHRV